MRALAVCLLLPFTAFAAKEDVAPLVGTQKHSPLSVRRCQCRDGFLKDSRIPASTCQGSIHGKVTEFPVYRDLCRSIEISQKAEGPTETATSYLGPKEVIVGIGYGDSSLEISEEWMKAIVTE